MNIPGELASVLTSDPEVMHGAVCFAGTRVPLVVLLDNLSEGMSVEEFLVEYPSVDRPQVLAVVSWQQDEMKRSVGLDRAS